MQPGGTVQPSSTFQVRPGSSLGKRGENVQGHLGHDHQCGETGIPGRSSPWLQVGGDRAMPNVQLPPAVYFNPSDIQLGT